MDSRFQMLCTVAAGLSLLPLAISHAIDIQSRASTSVNIVVTKNETVDIPRTLYGYMWEDINHGGDGGLYAELLQNRAFQAITPGTADTLTPWAPISGVSLNITNAVAGVSAALPNSLQVSVAAGASGTVSFSNTGYWGIKVQAGWEYDGSFYVKSSSYTGPVTVALQSLDSSAKVYATATPVKKVNSTWTKYTYTFSPSVSAPDENNQFVVELDGSQAAGKTVYFGLFTLFPPTYKGRQNGLRIDLAETIAATQPGVWRFGGNNLEGDSIASRFIWNETIGPLENRPGRMGDWGYVNTDGFGILEHFQWAEDIGAEMILGVWDGIATGDYSDLPSWPIVPEDQLQPYIDSAINEIEFLTGDASTNEWAALRAKYGRKEPFQLKYIEVGNEDQFQEDSYAAYRWPMFVNQLSAKFPNLVFIATSYPDLALDPPYHYIDYHMYNAPDWFMTNAFLLDDYPRNDTYWFLGEMAVTSTNDNDLLGTPADGRLTYPTLQGASAEAAFMTGLERNADVAFASAYAPTMQNINYTNWTPDLITFNQVTVAKSISYYTQYLFSTNKGTQGLKTSPVSSAEYSPLFWSASRNNQTNGVIIKVANAGTESIATTFTLGFPVSGTASVTYIAPGSDGLYNTSNTLDNPNLVVPQTKSVALKGQTLNYTFPEMSVTVIKLAVSGAW